MDLEHRAQDLLWPHGISQSPARHGKRLGEPVDHNRPFIYGVDAGDGRMLSLVGQLGIDPVSYTHLSPAR